MTAFADRVTSLEKENRELKNVIVEMTAKIGHQEAITSEIAERHASIETAITKIAEHVQGQASFNESAKRSINCLENQVETHQNNFKEVVKILRVHEQHIEQGPSEFR